MKKFEDPLQNNFGTLSQKTGLIKNNVINKIKQYPACCDTCSLPQINHK